MVTASVAAACFATAVAVLAPAALAAVPAYHSPGYAGKTRLGSLVPMTLPSITLGTGKYPRLLVDRAGTAHVVFAGDGGGSAADTISYCGLQRGRASCGATTPVPNPVEPEGDPNYPGNFPAGNHDFDGPVPLDIGNTLYIVDRRFPDSFPTPGGGSSESNVFLWSQDAVTGVISGPAPIGNNEMGGGAIGYGGTANPSIGTISATETGGTFFQGVPAGQYTTSQAKLGTGDQAYDGGLAIDGTTPVAVFADLSGNIFVREYLGNGDINDAGNWSKTSFTGYSPQIIGGPAGVFVLYRDGALSDSNVLLRKIVGGQPSGSPVTLSGAVSDPTISEDPSGRIAYGFVDSLGVEVRTSGDGGTFSAPELTASVPSGATVSDLSVAATGDGGGFATFVKDGTGAEDVGTVVASAFGTQNATGLPGLGTLQGGGIGSPIGDQLATSTCNTATFGLVEAKLDAGCWFHDPSQPTLDVSLGPVDINGLEIVPDANAKILIDPRLHSIDTVGSVSVQLRAPGITVTLWHGEVHVKLPLNTPDGFPLFDFSPPSAPDLLGFPIDGKIDAKLIKGGVLIPVSLGLQPASFFGGVTGSATLQATLNGGLMVNSLLFTVGDVSLGAFELKDVRISYQNSGDTWMGQGTLNVPTGGDIFHMSIAIEFQHGNFVKGTVVVGFPYPGIPLDDNDAPAQQLWFDQFGLTVGLSPPLVGGTVDFGFTPTEVPGGDATSGARDFLFSLHGGATISFGDPVTLTLTATGFLESLQVEQGKLVYKLPDTITFTGTSGVDFGLIKESGIMSAIFDPPHKVFGARIAGVTTIDLSTLNPLFPPLNIKGNAFAINNDGFAIFASHVSYPLIPPPGISVSYHWGDKLPALTLGDATAPFTKGIPGPAVDAGAHAHAAASTTFTVPRNAPALNIQALGSGGAPQVVLTDPRGRQIMPSTSFAHGNTTFEIGSAAADTTYVGVSRPAAGRWSVQQAPGSTVPLTDVSFALALPEPKIHAKLSGHGSKKTVHYRVSLPPGMTVMFAEQTKTLLHVVGSAKHRAGTLHFTPAIGSPGRRQLVALIENRGLPFRQQVIGSYTVPRPPKPGRSQHVQIASSGRAFTVTFSPAKHAVRSLIHITTSDGRNQQQLVSTTTHRISIPVIGYNDSATVTVTGVDATGRHGPTVKARPMKRRTHHRHKHHR